MKTCTASELEVMTSAFEFTITATGTMHGFGAWFDVLFGGDPVATPLILSTSPTAPLTHWKHTLLVLNEPISVTAGDAVKGVYGMV